MEELNNTMGIAKSNGKKSPIVIFAYKRAKHLTQLFESLIKNKDYEESTIYIFIDGIKNYSDNQGRSAVLDVVNKFSNDQTEIQINKKNLGLAENITQGLDYVFARHETAIILEDDLIIGDNFLEYMNKSLNVHRFSANIWHISGWTPIDVNNGCDIYISQAMFCWGWGTWRDRWQHFKRKNSSKYISREKIYRLNYENSFLVWDQIIQNQVGLKKTWAAFWALTIFQNNGYCVNPRCSLVYNNGLDGTGENSLAEINSHPGISNVKLNVTDIEIRELTEHREKLTEFFKGKVHKISRLVSHLSYITDSYRFTVKVYYYLIKVYFRVRTITLRSKPRNEY